MPYKSSIRYARISPRKARLLVDLIRGKTFDEALTALQFSKKRAAVMVNKTLEAAAANADNQGEIKPRQLVVTEARVDEGPTIKRWQPKDRGRAHPINKRTSHIHVTVDEG
ncbi:MAG: 50S ribosomal protein L22 [Phycisphaeraceae bacterium]|nr:50S ribosomal protein L22 [Phycisphaeraceae bacterium]